VKQKRSVRARKRPLLVAIVGGSGAGKSWLADQLQAELGSLAVRLSLDDFYRDRSYLSPKRRATINFDHPRAIDWAALRCALRGCVAGRSVRLPRYDFKTHSRLRGLRLLRPRPIILIDGLWLLRRATRALFDFGIFLDCGTSTRFDRRVLRDLRVRGRTSASVKKQFRATVEPMHVRYVAPQARLADIVLSENCGRSDVRRLAKLLRLRIGPWARS
jgi:uridine kinase